LSGGAARRQNSTDEDRRKRDVGIGRPLTRAARGAGIALVLALVVAAPAARRSRRESSTAEPFTWNPATNQTTQFAYSGTVTDVCAALS
jgi:hypothetical protein